MSGVTNEKKELIEGQYNWFLYGLFVVFIVILLSIALIFLYLGLPGHKYSVTLWIPVIALLGLSAAMILFRKKLIVTKDYIQEKSGFVGFSQKSSRYKVSDFASILVDTHCLLTSQNEFGSATKAIYVYLVPKGSRPKIPINEYAAGFGVDVKVLKSKVDFAKSIKNITGLRVDYSESIRNRFSDVIIRGNM